MNPVAAGGVVALAWYREEDGREVPLIRASDLEACQQRCAELEAAILQFARELDTARDGKDAAQAEADRLRVDIAGKVREALDRESCPDHWMRVAYEAAIHAAKTEQERGE